MDHYKNIHNNCSQTSRCKTDRNYQPSRIVITDRKAEELIRTAIKKSTLYKFADKFVLGKETAHVESFNNTMNMFHDKRIYYSDEEYAMRSHMAVLHWNENVGRDHTSVWQPGANRAGTRGARKRKNYKDPTYTYRSNVWTKYMDLLFA